MAGSDGLIDGFGWIRPEGFEEEPRPGRVRVAAVQMEPRLGDPGHSLDRCLAGARAAAGAGSRLVVYPECALTGYCVASPEEARAAAVEPGGPELARLARASRETGAALVVGYLERRPGGGVANTVSVFEDGSATATYRKTHLPHLGADRFTEAGCEPFRVHLAAGLRLGLLICYDASFPEASRVLALEGAELILLPTNWPEEAEAKAAWLPNTRAYENVVYFAAVNRIGEERGFRFHGRSRICGPTGATLVDGPVDREAILLVDVDPERARTKRIVRREGYWVDRIGQRREDLYRLVVPPASQATDEVD
jgi:predicted amidohydrolase